MGDFLCDLRYSIRRLGKAPGFGCTVIVALALGISANTAVFSVINATLFRALPYANPDELEVASQTLSVLEVQEWREANHSFSELVGYRINRPNLTVNGVMQRDSLRCEISGDLFKMLGVSPFLGRTFLDKELREGSHVVILSFDAWSLLMNSDPLPTGKVIRLGGIPHVVAGVMPKGFTFPPGTSAHQTEVWTPLALPKDIAVQRTDRVLKVVGRLKPNVSLGQAQAEARIIVQHFESSGAEPQSIVLTGLGREITHKTRAALLSLMGAVGFVLLIACTNVAMLLLSRSSDREKDIATRRAIGASRGRVIRQLLTEALVFAIPGGALGFLIAFWTIHTFPLWARWIAVDLPANPNIDVIVFAFTSGLSLITTVMFGLVPALQLSKTDVASALKDSSASHNSGGSTIRTVPLTCEIAATLILLIGATLLMRTLSHLWSVQLGFSPKNMLVAIVELPRSKYEDREQWEAFWTRVLDELRSLPGIRDASAVNGLPFWGYSKMQFTVEGQQHNQRLLSVQTMMVAPHYFSTMGTPQLIGRDFTTADTVEAPKVVIINESMQQIFWPNRAAVGQTIVLDSGAKADIIGVVGDIHQEGFSRTPEPTFYLPYSQFPSPGATLVIRTAADAHAVVQRVSNEIQRLDPDITLSDVTTMEEVLEDSIATQRLAGMLLSTFAAVALLLALVGVFGLTAYMVAQRTREIGLRIALGATPSAIHRMVLKQAMAPVLMGVMIGIASSIIFTRVLASLLFAVTPTDLITFCCCAVSLVLAGSCASLIPVHRATTVDPAVVLKN